MEELYVLGNSTATAVNRYNTCFAIRRNRDYFLVDCGGGNTILRKLQSMRIPVEEIHHIFITNQRADHCLGLIWLFRLMARRMHEGTLSDPVSIYAHKELIPILEHMCRWTINENYTRFIGKLIHFVPLEDGDQKQILGETVTFFDIHSDKTKQFGFTMTLETGKRLTFTGNEPCRKPIHHYVEVSDWLLHEAYCMTEDAPRFHPEELGFSTVIEVCEFASQMKIANLVLWHSEDVTDITTHKGRFLAEGEPHFNGNLIVPDDEERIFLR